MKRIKSICIVLLIFFSGVVVGGIMGGGAVMHDYVNKTFRDGPPAIRKVLLQRAKTDLKLDEDQSHQFWQVLNDTGAELRKVIEPVRPELESTLARADLRFRAILKPHQLPNFENFVAAAKKRWTQAMAVESANVEQPAVVQ